MRHRWLMSFSMCLLLSAGAHADDTLSNARQQELQHLLRHDCGSCHGMTLKGGLGPALLPERLQHKPAVALEAIIRHGVAGSAMPPWGPLLTDTEIRWLVQRLKDGTAHKEGAAHE